MKLAGSQTARLVGAEEGVEVRGTTAKKIDFFSRRASSHISSVVGPPAVIGFIEMR